MTTTNLVGCVPITPVLLHVLNGAKSKQDSENNTILILLADLKPPIISRYGTTDPDSMGAALRMARLYYDRYNFILDWSNLQGKTALHVASLKGNEELVRVSIPNIPS